MRSRFPIKKPRFENFLKENNVKKYFTIFLWLLLFGAPGFSQEYEFNRKNQLSLSAGLEYLNYEEIEPDTGLTSSSKPSNAVLCLKYKASISKRHMFVGKLVFPVSMKTNEEKWWTGGAHTQTNSLNYRWARLDMYAVSPFENNFSGFFGLRLSHANQTREHFVVGGVPASGNAVETINSLGLLAGFQSEYAIKKVGVKYQAAYVFPVAARVTNTAVPGSFNSKNGYTLEGSVEIFFNKNVSLEVAGGKMHWNGSGWRFIPETNQFVKWPENNTRYTNLLLTLYF